MTSSKKSDAELRKQLSNDAYEVTQHKATEAPFSGKYNDFSKQGDYYCICCHAKLFSSHDKFNSGCGWPSFTKPHNAEVLAEHEDRSLMQIRTEVVCHNCGAHLGHVFPDGPAPTGLRYCINSVALDFEEE